MFRHRRGHPPVLDADPIPARQIRGFSLKLLLLARADLANGKYPRRPLILFARIGASFILSLPSLSLPSFVVLLLRSGQIQRRLPAHCDGLGLFNRWRIVVAAAHQRGCTRIRIRGATRRLREQASSAYQCAGVGRLGFNEAVRQFTIHSQWSDWVANHRISGDFSAV
jgi:hypothetical protein